MVWQLHVIVESVMGCLAVFTAWENVLPICLRQHQICALHSDIFYRGSPRTPLGFLVKNYCSDQHPQKKHFIECHFVVEKTACVLTFQLLVPNKPLLNLGYLWQPENWLMDSSRLQTAVWCFVDGITHFVLKVSSALSADELRKLSWSGIPKSVRPTAWKILSVSSLSSSASFCPT